MGVMQRRAVARLFDDLAMAVTSNDRVHVILAIRADYLPVLMTYRSGFPDGLNTRFYLRALTGTQAYEVIQQAFASTPVEITPDQIKAIVSQLGDSDGESLTAAVFAESIVSPLQLQIVCRDWWARAAGEVSSSDGPLQTYGLDTVDAALVRYVDEQLRMTNGRLAVNERVLRVWLERNFLSPGGFRRQVTPDEEGVAGAPREILDELVERKILQRANRGRSEVLEVSHDRLATALRTSNRARFRSTNPGWFRSHGGWIAVLVSLVFTSGLVLFGQTPSERVYESHEQQLTIEAVRGYSGSFDVGEDEVLVLILNGGEELPDASAVEKHNKQSHQLSRDGSALTLRGKTTVQVTVPTTNSDGFYSFRALIVPIVVPLATAAASFTGYQVRGAVAAEVGAGSAIKARSRSGMRIIGKILIGVGVVDPSSDSAVVADDGRHLAVFELNSGNPGAVTLVLEKPAEVDFTSALIYVQSGLASVKNFDPNKSGDLVVTSYCTDPSRILAVQAGRALAPSVVLDNGVVLSPSRGPLLLAGGHCGVTMSRVEDLVLDVKPQFLRSDGGGVMYSFHVSHDGLLTLTGARQKVDVQCDVTRHLDFSQHVFGPFAEDVDASEQQWHEFVPGESDCYALVESGFSQDTTTVAFKSLADAA